ncbi:phosphotransferase [Streptomyces sp. A5-4]|uniref:phosphotransferase n=1 Tax=Streptomyces sp. A5-4 TaxID=3384771 RepID=UPI003DA9F197
MGSVEISSEEERAAGWIPVHVDLSGRSLWHVPGAGSAGTKAARYVKRYAALRPYGRELRALQQVPDGHTPHMLGHRRNPPTLVLRELPGVRLDDPAAGNHARWMQVMLEVMVSSVGLPGPWPDDPPPQTSELQAELGKALASHAPASTQALRRAIQDPVRVPCHGDATPPNVLVNPGQPRVWLLDYEFCGSGDPLDDLAASCLTASGCHRVPLGPTGRSGSTHSWPCGDGANRGGAGPVAQQPCTPHARAAGAREKIAQIFAFPVQRAVDHAYGLYQHVSDQSLLGRCSAMQTSHRTLARTPTVATPASLARRPTGVAPSLRCSSCSNEHAPEPD